MDKYDIGIIGAGIAGSCLSILLADAGKSVVVIEKNAYPEHKVCGEFLSLESYHFFKSIGLPLDDWDLPIIKHLELTSQKGRELVAPLKMGGFGLSRYTLDYELSEQMKRSGVHFVPETKVTKVENGTIKSSAGNFTAALIIGAHGKYAPNYLTRPKTHNNHNYIGVKYHIKGDFNSDFVSLHSFDGGYCGMSKIENDLYCLCYLANSQKLNKHENTIKHLEENILFKNKRLANVFERADFVWEKPLVISNIKFNKQEVHTNEMLFVGDAAGSISPLSGNGMSIAARSALLLSQLILSETHFNTLAEKYNVQWDRHFGRRVNKANLLNTIMLNPTLHHMVLKALQTFSPLQKKVINDMQGKAFVRDTKLIR